MLLPRCRRTEDQPTISPGVACDFIRRCLTIDPAHRLTAHEALSHPFVAEDTQVEQGSEDLLPVVKKNFNARRTLHAAIDTIRAINKLRDVGGAAAAMMSGAMAMDPKPAAEPPVTSAEGQLGIGDAAEHAGVESGQGGGGDTPMPDQPSPSPSAASQEPSRRSDATFHKGLWSPPETKRPQ